MAPASKAKRPKRTFEVRSFLGPARDLEGISYRHARDDGGGAASVAEYVFGAHSQGPPGKDLAL